MIDGDLHVVMTHAIDENSFELEVGRKLRKFHQSSKFDRLVNLRHLTNESDESDILECLDVLNQWAVLNRLDEVDDSLNVSAEIQRIVIDFEPLVEALELRSGKLENVGTKLREKIELDGL